MKKKFLVLVLGLCIVGGAFVGCNKASANGNKVEDSIAKEDNEINNKDVSSDDGVVMPIYKITSPNNAYVNGGYNVSFTKDDVKRIPSEFEVSYKLTVKVQDYDRYSVKDIEGLKEGDKINIGGKNVIVKSVKSSDDGGEKPNYNINGGQYEEDGYTLVFSGDFFSPVADSLIEIYNEVGEVTLPVATDAIYIDYSQDAVNKNSTDGITVKKDAGALLEDVINKYSGEQGYDCGNTSIVVHEGQIIQIIKHYMP